MKHFLKPLGHCLTTAVMTSAMLRVYALPPVEAATLDVDPQPTSSDTATSEGAAALAAPNLSVSAPVAPPEVIDYVESAPAPEPAVAPVASPAEPVTSASELVNTPSEALSVEPASEAEGEPVNGQAAPTADAKPDAASSQSSAQPSQSADKPEAESSADSSSIDSEAEDAKQTPPSAQKPDTRPSRTVAGMRQIVEKRLETLVEQDKESREAKWQQSIIQMALEYAWQGKFDAARKVAANASLPLELQISLLSKIAAIETEFLASQVAQSPNAAGNQSQSKLGGQAANSQGRTVPSGYATVDGLSAVSSYAGISFGNQCPAVEAPPTKSISPPQASPRPTAALKRTSGIPDFIPALGQNLASRLAHLSQTQNSLSSAKPVTPPSQQLVSPELFAGVAASSIQAQSSSLANPAKVSQPKVSPPKISQTKVSPPKVSQPQVSQSQVSQLKATQSEPVVAASIQSPQRAEQPFAERLFPSQLSPQPQFSATHAAQMATADPLRQIEPQTANSQPQAGSPLGGGFQSFSFAFPELFDNPLDWVWNWWDVPTPEVEEPFADSVTSRSMAPIASASSRSLAAEVGLNSKQLFQTLQQELSPRLQPLRNVRKLSISLSSTKNVSLKAPLKAPVDSSALLAISCNRAQLGQSSWTNALINPATAKQFGWVNFMFPLPIPAVITSAFGWRTHPISGDLRFHTGLDLGAPMGTPVLSAASGRVVVADAMGGYGLAVVVEDETTHQRNLYAHLSGIAVQPGATVRQGTVLGWVGSTGNSTGPHLHFESQVKTENGWTVIDPLASAAVTVAQSKQE